MKPVRTLREVLRSQKSDELLLARDFTALLAPVKPGDRP